MKRLIIPILLQLALLSCISAVNALHIAYFSPHDHPTKQLIKLIDEAKKKIHAAVYMITDKTIAEALVRAKKERQVDVEVITDTITITSIFGKAHFLQEHGIPVYSFAKKESNNNQREGFYYNAPAIMHHKFALIDDYIWSGSFNWTRAANQKNHEHVTLSDEKELYYAFEKEFEMLKKQCSLLEKKEVALTTTKRSPVLTNQHQMTLCPVQ